LPASQILVVAGEPSGDAHGANLLRELKRMGLDFCAFGIGGDSLRSSGMELISHFGDLSVVGFWEVMRRLPALRRAMRDLFRAMLSRRPDIVVLIDYPGFNLRFARLARQRGYKTLYYITPQIWAWGGWRMRAMHRFVDRLVVVLPFEKRFYENLGLDVSFVGHPILDLVERRLSRHEFCSRLGLNPGTPIIGILPGSRADEVKRILPTLLLSVRNLEDAQYVLALSPNLDRSSVEEIVARLLPKVVIVTGMTYEAMGCSDLLLVASGTATLEAAILATPMIIVYKVSLVSWLIAKLLVKTPHISLVNIVAGREVVPEFIQFRATPRRLSSAISELLHDRATRESMTAELKRVSEMLGGRGATERAARIVVEMLQ